MKNIKKFVALCAALTLCFGFGMAVTACGEDKPESSNKESVSTSESTQSSTSDFTSDSISDSTSEGETDKTYTAYEITVLNADGTPATNVQVQLCTSKGCYSFLPVDKNGLVIYNLENFSPDKYDIHVFTMDYQPLPLVEAVITEATFGAYTVTLAN